MHFIHTQKHTHKVSARGFGQDELYILYVDVCQDKDYAVFFFFFFFFFSFFSLSLSLFP